MNGFHCLPPFETTKCINFPSVIPPKVGKCEGCALNVPQLPTVRQPISPQKQYSIILVFLNQEPLIADELSNSDLASSAHNTKGALLEPEPV